MTEYLIIWMTELSLYINIISTHGQLMIMTIYQLKQKVIWWSYDEYLMIMYWLSVEYFWSSVQIVRLSDDYLMIISSPLLDFQTITWRSSADHIMIICWSCRDHLMIIWRISDDYTLIFRCSSGDNLWKIINIIRRLFVDHLNIIGRLFPLGGIHL